MTIYEEGLMKYLRGMKERRLAEKDKVDELIDQKYKEHANKLRRELGWARIMAKIAGRCLGLRC